MNMILHNNPTALIVQGNTLADPKFKDGDTLKTFDYVVANPPFSDKRWSTGLDPLNDPYERFKPFGTPPAKQGDYAYLLHIVRSLKSTGKGACILPHGVLFRGNAEADIRRNLIRKGYIKGIIGLPANLFYGTGIPACIVVIDKEDAHARKGIFMIDASEGFMKDGPKNRLRAQDIHKIVDVFTRRLEVPQYSRMVPRRGDREERVQPQPAALHRQPSRRTCRTSRATCGAASPTADVDALERYWAGLPAASASAVQEGRPPRLPRSRRATSRHQAHHLRAPGVRRLHRRHERPFRRLAEDKRRHAQGLARPAAIPRSHRRLAEDLLATTPASRSSTPTTSISTSWTTGPRPCRTTAT